MAKIFKLVDMSDFDGHNAMHSITEDEAEPPEYIEECTVYVSETASTFDVVQMLKEVIERLEAA